VYLVLDDRIKALGSGENAELRLLIVAHCWNWGMGWKREVLPSVSQGLRAHQQSPGLRQGAREFATGV
jgi:hypothetical protein